LIAFAIWYSLHVHNQLLPLDPTANDLLLEEDFSFFVQARAAMDPFLMMTVFRALEFFRNIFVPRDEECVHPRDQQALYRPKIVVQKEAWVQLY
jgi:hypothetical protein